jgi:hypothetical protein
MTSKVDAEIFEAAVASLVATDATKAAQSDLEATNALVATKAAQSALDATNALVATKADQAALDVEIERLDQAAAKAASNATKIETLQGATTSLFESVGELDTRVTGNAAAIATKASQEQLDFVGQNFQPRITAFEPLSLVPRVDPQNNPSSELSVDLSAYATSAALTAVQGALESTDQALVDLAAQVDGKQDALSAGTGLVYHEKLLEANTIKSLTAGNNVTLTSTGEFVSISAEGGGATSVEGPAAPSHWSTRQARSGGFAPARGPTPWTRATLWKWVSSSRRPSSRPPSP